MTDTNPANPHLSDQEVMNYINRRLREEKIDIKERLALFSGEGTPYVDLETKLSRQGRNYIEINITPVPPTEEELKSAASNRRKLKSLLPSTLMRNEFEIGVYAPQPEDETRDIVLCANVVGGIVNEVSTPNISPYHSRLRIGDPLEKVLNVAFKAYRTRYASLQTPPRAGF